MIRAAPYRGRPAEDDFSNLGDTTTLADPAVVDDLVHNRQNKKVAAKAGA